MPDLLPRAHPLSVGGDDETVQCIAALLEQVATLRLERNEARHLARQLAKDPGDTLVTLAEHGRPRWL